MATTHIGIPPAVRRGGRRAGYGLAILINLGLLFVVGNLVEWNVFPWLTDTFIEVVPWISFSLLASIVVNVIYQINDSRPVRSVGQIGTNLVSIVVTARLLEVFPFDFSAYRFDWETVTRIVLILAIVGAGIGVLTETITLTKGVGTGKEVGDVDDI